MNSTDPRAWLLVLWLCTAPASALADSAAESLLATLREQHPGTPFSSVRPTAVAGLFEVLMQDNVAYVVAAQPRYFLFGRLFDSQTLRELTAPTPLAYPPAVDMQRLPLADAMTVVRGTGQRRLVVFSDPACPYCQALEAELAAIDNLTLSIFPLPFLGEPLPVRLWCAPDRQQAWQRWMLQQDETGLAPPADCDHPLLRNAELARQLGIDSTPTLLWADGQRSRGALRREQIEARLQHTAAPQAQP